MTIKQLTRHTTHTDPRRAPVTSRSESWANLQLAIGARSKAPTNDYFEYMTNKQRTK